MPSPSTSLLLCSPGRGLSCFACCPPIRPAGYDHIADRSSWRRFFSDNRAAFLRGELPARPILGFFCPGLGFLDSAGRAVGCLYHPAGNAGRDLRQATGYQQKCARESCPEARAFARLAREAQDRLLDLCAGLDAFEFGSRRANPVMRLLAYGPETAAALAGLGLTRDEIAALAWLAGSQSGPDALPVAWGWLAGRLAATQGPEMLLRPDLAAEATEIVARLGRALGPAPPLAGGRPDYSACDEWEARFWRGLAAATDLESARAALAAALSLRNS
ncbi:MAG: hypothetical protein ACOZHQ_08580 [Thermodesulfobacteriota bacterium]